MKRGRGDHVFNVNEGLLARQILHLKYTAYNRDASVYKPFLSLKRRRVSMMTGPVIDYTLLRLGLANEAISTLLVSS